MIGQISGKCVFHTFSSSFASLDFVTLHCVGDVCAGSLAWGEAELKGKECWLGKALGCAG